MKKIFAGVLLLLVAGAGVWWFSLGKDARAVLADLGYDAERIEALLSAGAVGESE